jgi:hypothetical protein
MAKIRGWAGVLVAGAIAVSSAGAKEGVETCLEEFPELLSR